MLTGPFANFIATVDTIDPRQRIWVLMEFTGQKTRMQVAADQIQPAKSITIQLPSLLNSLESFQSPKCMAEITLFM